jgi:release factor glutamine methyltransferase
LKETVQQLHHRLKERLIPVTASVEQAAAEAVLLMEGVLGLESAAIYSGRHQTVPEANMRALDYLLEERVERRIPVQYLLHQAWFYGMAFYVNPHVLIPRPETEHLVEAALTVARQYLSAQSEPASVKILDVGTGSGAIAIALSHTLKGQADVSAVDVSSEALRVARLNQRMLGSTVDFLPVGDLLTPLSPGIRFDCIVSNPPYIDLALKDTLMPEVLWHEPASALFPPDEREATHFYRRLATESLPHLAPCGSLLVEVGAGMAEAVCAIFAENGFGELSIKEDYAGIGRVVSGRRPAL